MRQKRPAKILIAILALAIAFVCAAMTACSDEPATPIPTISVKTLVQLEEGNSEQLAPSVTIDGEAKEGGAFTYKSADPTVASVSAAGLIKANKKGETTVTVSGTYEGEALGDVTVTVKVSEAPIVDPQIEAGYTDISIFVNDTRTLDPIVVDGEREFSDGEFTFASGDDTVASVTAQGLITGLKKGTTQVTVQCTFRGRTLDAVTVSV